VSALKSDIQLSRQLVRHFLSEGEGSFPDIQRRLDGLDDDKKRIDVANAQNMNLQQLDPAAAFELLRSQYHKRRRYWQRRGAVLEGGLQDLKDLGIEDRVAGAAALAERDLNVEAAFLRSLEDKITNVIECVDRWNWSGETHETDKRVGMTSEEAGGKHV
jgi:hypothetical protein